MAVVKYLTAIALVCALISAGVLFFDSENARDIVQITFTPVATIVAGLIGYLKS
ncbi:MAG: hypothetical protein U9N86_09185 [Bacteroidota bacterium]|nr:hypothetical protein [Bacteroidota bacterium]